MTGTETKWVPVEVLDALRQFRHANGRAWKSKLRTLWLTNGDADEPLLRQARNIVGPSGLDRIGL